MVTKVTGSFFGKMGEHMNQNDGFYTMKGYRLQSDSKDVYKRQIITLSFSTTAARY